MSLIANKFGKTINIFNLKADDILLEDIVRSLSNICRFGGRIDIHYSVAQHSCELAKWLFCNNEADLVKLALLHDACEAYIGDIIYPIKIKIPLFEELETKITNIILDKFKVNKSRLEDFDYYDKNIVVNEMKALNIYEENKSLPTVSSLKELPNLTIIPNSISEVRHEYKALLKAIL